MAARGQRSSVVEQLFRKQQVFGSNPNVGSSFLYLKRAFWGDRSSRRIAFDSSFDSNPAQDTEVFELIRSVRRHR